MRECVATRIPELEKEISNAGFDIRAFAIEQGIDVS
jgi:hypothetical protein